MSRAATWLLFAVGAASTVSGARAADGCDRACLRGVLDRYLAAVIAHNPQAAPLAYGYRHTENAINRRPGDGIWKSVTGFGVVQRRYLDPVSGQAAYYGILQEGEKLAVVTARLRVEDRQVTEAEWYIARDGDPGLPGATPPNYFNPASLTATPPPERVIPKAQRLPRASMTAIVDSYFDGITAHDGSVVLARKGCNRYENGTRVTGRRGGVGRLRFRPRYNLQNVAAIPLVDEEAGMVLGMAVFIRRPGSPVRRNSFSEWFVIQDGKIHDIYTAMFYPDPLLPVPNWPPFNGNWPLPADTAAASAPVTSP
jgi:hypothetical protein